MVKWSESSKKDLKNIYDYIAEDSVHYAKKEVSSIVKKAKSLSSFPARGRMVPEIMDEHIREIIIFQYRVIYSISPDNKNVEILAVLHGKRDFDDAFQYPEE
ncbi:MAG TPA: type II toxin-antitoxin system RelE/ParE family toxin [Spirochaetota bacterium]|nr:type II toxin-antitoxin system RelE/ParE family toxin [Spirochaetota bacterium]HQO03119.1 type II toxin-antitoxin system RelE/ParE family toxin [Spirochaetota bacterium]HQP50142.1 type II toxin-antitoxin system RelE/ParE family toxin [Spirochaetota bacterium]